MGDKPWIGIEQTIVGIIQFGALKWIEMKHGYGEKGQRFEAQEAIAGSIKLC
jgi:hypothetical protein